MRDWRERFSSSVLWSVILRPITKIYSRDLPWSLLRPHARFSARTVMVGLCCATVALRQVRGHCFPFKRIYISHVALMLFFFTFDREGWIYSFTNDISYPRLRVRRTRFRILFGKCKTSRDFWLLGLPLIDFCKISIYLSQLVF